MMLRRALYAEALKLKRTIALKMVVLAPLAAPYRAGDKSPRHDHALLAQAFRGAFAQV